MDKPYIGPLTFKVNPYLGPRPFSQVDANRFFGRDRETVDLCSLISAHRTVLLYSQSGAGKSSLLNAGVIPALQASGFDVLPTARVAGATEKTLPPGVDNVYVFNCKRFWSEESSPPNATLTQVLSSRPRRTDASGGLLPCVVVFDQFEELFTAYTSKWQQRRDFFIQLNQSMTADASLRVLFAMREDFIAHLDPYEDLLPEELRTRYRLEQLRSEAALAAIEKPLEETGIHFEPGVAKILVADLLSVGPVEQDGMNVRGEFVDPVQLQVVCFSLFGNLPSDTSEISETQLKKFGDVNLALGDFYQGTLRVTAAKTGVPEDELRRWFETELLTESGTRDLVFRGVETTGRLPNAAVDLLEELHIIRADVRGANRWYELSHDRFIQPVLRANDEWRAEVEARAAARAREEAAAEAARREKEAAQKGVLEQARALADEQKLRAEVSAVAARRLRRGLRFVIVLLVLAVTTSIWAFVERGRARRSALEAQVKAEEARANAERAATQSAVAQFNAQVTQGLVRELAKSKGTTQSDNTAHPQSRIKHVIVLMMENRSFDHMLGALKAQDQRIEGLTGNESNPDSTGSTVRVQPLASFQGQLDPDPGSRFPAVDEQIFDGSRANDRVATMQGFITSYFKQRSDVNHSHIIMYYFTPEKLPVLTTLATQFAICDHWFSSVPGPTLPNRAFAHYGTSFGRVDMNPILPVERYQSIFERMVDRGHTAKLYYYDQVSGTIAVGLLSQRPQIFGTFSDFLADAASGHLPEYSVVEPNYSDHSGPDGQEILATDQHPDHNVQAGEIFIATVYNAIHSNKSLWESSILVLTYSNHGGSYDHVPPPAAVPDGFVAPPGQTGTGIAFAFDRLGVRVPAIIISPYIAKGTVDHTVYDHSSIPATVSKLFIDGQLNVSPRERSAHTFENLLTLKSPRTDAPSFSLK